jgi:hypothetical protein
MSQARQHRLVPVESESEYRQAHSMALLVLALASLFHNTHSGILLASWEKQREHGPSVQLRQSVARGGCMLAGSRWLSHERGAPRRTPTLQVRSGGTLLRATVTGEEKLELSGASLQFA